MPDEREGHAGLIWKALRQNGCLAQWRQLCSSCSLVNTLNTRAVALPTFFVTLTFLSARTEAFLLPVLAER